MSILKIMTKFPYYIIYLFRKCSQNLSYTLNSSVKGKVWFIYKYRWLFLQNFTDINFYLVVGDPVSKKYLDSFASRYSCCLENNKLAIVLIASTKVITFSSPPPSQKKIKIYRLMVFQKGHNLSDKKIKY